MASLKSQVPLAVSRQKIMYPASSHVEARNGLSHIISFSEDSENWRWGMVGERLFEIFPLRSELTLFQDWVRGSSGFTAQRLSSFGLNWALELPSFWLQAVIQEKKNCGCQVNHMYECVAYNSAVNTKNVSVSSIWRRLHAALAVLTFVMALQTTLGKSHLDPRLWGHHGWWWWWPWLYFDFWFTKHFTYIILPLCLILYLTSFEMMSIMAMIISSSTIIRNYFFIYVRCFNSGPCYVARLV